MEFEADKPIFRQVADYCVAQISSGAWVEGGRLPSTKELAVSLAVNNRTVMKAYDMLSEAEVIFQRRGMGYYVADNAGEKLRDFFRREFVTSTLPNLRKEMTRASITPEELMRLLEQ